VIRGVFLIAILALGGCGGKTERGGEGVLLTEGGSGSGGPPITPLGACELGFVWENDPSRPCPWIAEGRCYDTKEEACACICPRDRKSFCVSPSPGERVDVTCS
jgi:hypothetical protein